MKGFFALLLIILNIINIPLSFVFMKVQRWYLPMWKKDKIIYFAFAPFYWTLFVLAFAFGYPCEKLMALAH